MDSKTMQTILRLISDAQFTHAPDKYRDDESAYRFHEGIYEGLQMAFDIVESVGRKLKEDQRLKKHEYNKKYRESHREQAYQKLKEWRKNNPEKWKAQKAREREKKRMMQKEGEAD